MNSIQWYEKKRHFRDNCKERANICGVRKCKKAVISKTRGKAEGYWDYAGKMSRDTSLRALCAP